MQYAIIIKVSFMKIRVSHMKQKIVVIKSFYVLLGLFIMVLISKNVYAAEGNYLWPVPSSRTINQ